MEEKKRRRKHDETFTRFLTRERAADIISLVFRSGVRDVDAESLEPFSTKTAEEGKRRMRRRERDFLYKCFIEKGSRTGFIFIGIENQLKGNDPSFLFRVMRYDADELERQLMKDGMVSGVITLCVYTGSEEWKSPTTIYGAMDEKQKESQFFPFMFDYGYYLVDMHKLTEDEVRLLRTEWRLFPSAIRARNKEELGMVFSRKEYLEADWETQRMLAECVGNEWIMDYIYERKESNMSNVMREYEKSVNAKFNEYDEKVNEMSNVMREYEKDVNKRLSEMNNEMKELSSNLEKVHESTATRMLKKGFSYSDISDISGLKFDEIERIAFEIASNEPEYKVE